MVSKRDLIKYYQEHDGEMKFRYNEEDDSMYEGDTFVSTMDEFLHRFRLSTGQAFESIYSCPGTLMNILRCEKCGTVIFSSDDYELYDKKLTCPTCTGYETYFDFWTKEEMESDPKKMEEIKIYEEMSRKSHEEYERMRKTGKTNRQITRHVLYPKNYMIQLILGCDDITESYFKGLRYEIIISKKENDDDFGYIRKKHIEIPLSWSFLYYRYLHRLFHKKKLDLLPK